MPALVDPQQWQPSDSQRTTFIIIAVYTLVILVFWNVRILSTLIFPFKIATVALHEFGHAFAGLLTGAKIEAIELDLNQGGVTRMRGGNRCCTLPGELCLLYMFGLLF
jgi:hypothetical protein